MARHAENTASTPAATEDVHRRVAAFALVPSWFGVAATIAVASLLPPLSLTARLVPLIASVLVFGVPHGAADHLALARVRGETPDLHAVARVVVLYAVIGGSYAVAWVLTPVPAALSFVVLTWFHWGQGDGYPLAALVPGDHPGTRVELILAAALRGALPMLAPLVAFPGQYRRVLRAMAAPFAADSPTLSWLIAEPTRTAVLVLLVALTAAAILPGLRHGIDSGVLVDAAEVGLLWLLFLTVPPLLAVGVYFVAWHSPRHVARLLAIDDGAVERLRTGRTAAALAAFVRDVAPTTVGSLAVLVAMYFLAPSRPTTLTGFAGLYLAFIAVLTLPHVVVVTLMDREQGVWSPDR